MMREVLAGLPNATGVVHGGKPAQRACSDDPGGLFG
jgi:hypothetical protein